MKNLILLISILLSTFCVFAQSDTKTETFKVEGTCEMCKKRIENAAYIKGVKRAEWNEETHQLTVVYRSSKTSVENIHQSLAKAGHSTDKAQASEADYSKLPECCQYKANTGKH